MQNTPICIASWSEEVIQDIRRFADYWNAKRESGDTDYPEKLSRGEWDEQFALFIDNAKVERS